MNNNTKALKRARHKAMSRERKSDRFHNLAMWLERKISDISGDLSDEDYAKAIGWSLDKFNQYKYGSPSRYGASRRY
jgi:hypothetical protein